MYTEREILGETINPKHLTYFFLIVGNKKILDKNLIKIIKKKKTRKKPIRIHIPLIKSPRSDNEWGSGLTGQTDSIMGQQLVRILWYIVQDPLNAARFISQQDFTHLWNTLRDIFCVARWSSLLNSFTISPGFSVEVESGWKLLHHGSAVSHPSHVHSSASVWSSMAVLLRNSFHTLLPFFLVDQVLASQIRAEEETMWEKLTPLWVSS